MTRDKSYAQNALDFGVRDAATANELVAKLSVQEPQIMNPEEIIETESIEVEAEFTDKGEQQALPQKPKVARVKKDLPKKKWRKQGLRKSTRSR